MRYSYIIVLLALFVAVSCRMNHISGNGKVKTEEREVSFFDKIDVSGNFDVDIYVADKIKIKINAEENLLKHIQTYVRNDELKISSRQNLRPTKEMSIVVYVPNLKSIECSGLNKIIVNDLQNDNLKIDLSGASNIKISGVTKFFQLDISGAADINAKEFLAEAVRLDVSGASNAEIFASKSVDVDVSGAGNVFLYGPASDVKMDVSGAGSFKRK